MTASRNRTARDAQESLFVLRSSRRNRRFAEEQAKLVVVSGSVLEYRPLNISNGQSAAIEIEQEAKDSPTLQVPNALSQGRFNVIASGLHDANLQLAGAS